MAQQKTEIQIPKGLTPSERVELADAVLEFIRLRTLGGLDKNNRKFHKYSPKYAEAKGVGRDEVDLNLSSEMMEAMTLLSHKNGKIVIGFEKDDPNNGKAEGNILGTYGNASPVTKGRDFLGITKTDLSQLVKNYDRAEEVDDGVIASIARAAASRLLGDAVFDD